MRAVVVFCDTTYRFAWLFKPGFRHCFVCVAAHGLWIKVEARHGIPDIKYLTTDDFDLARYFRNQGLAVVETEQRQRAVRFPLVARTCSGFVKAMLCIDAWWVFTPHQLYEYLRRT